METELTDEIRITCALREQLHSHSRRLNLTNNSSPQSRVFVRFGGLLQDAADNFLLGDSGCDPDESDYDVYQRFSKQLTDEDSWFSPIRSMADEATGVLRGHFVDTLRATISLVNGNEDSKEGINAGELSEIADKLLAIGLRNLGHKIVDRVSNYYDGDVKTEYLNIQWMGDSR